MITTNQEGFTKADLVTDNFAEIHATFDATCGDLAFEVTLEEETGGLWYFDQAGCREAAEFFTKLADELARREATK